MSDWLRELIKDRRRIFHTDEGRSPRWKAVKRRVQRIVKERRTKFDKYILDKFEADTNPGNFFKHIDGLLGANSKPRWSPTEMYPDLDLHQVSEELANFFNAISSEYRPLNMNKKERTHDRSLPQLSNEDIIKGCLLYTSPSPRDRQKARMPSSA